MLNRLQISALDLRLSIMAGVLVAMALVFHAFTGNFLTPEKRAFVLLPFMHSESTAMQKESVRLHMALGSEDNLKYARGHADIIERFGRFPRRNAALGRVSTEEEEAYMVATEGMF